MRKTKVSGFSTHWRVEMSLMRLFSPGAGVSAECEDMMVPYSKCCSRCNGMLQELELLVGVFKRPMSLATYLLAPSE